MSTCKNCSCELQENAKACPNCGTPVERDTIQNAADAVAAKFGEINNTADTTHDFDAKDIEENKIMAVLSYIWILFLVPLFAAPNSKFAKYHANQGIVLFIVSLVVGLVSSLFSLIGLGIIGNIIGVVFGTLWLILAILGIVNAATGKAKEIPFIGNIKILK